MMHSPVTVRSWALWRLYNQQALAWLPPFGRVSRDELRLS
jgi:hypothetical protein